MQNAVTSWVLENEPFVRPDLVVATRKDHEQPRSVAAVRFHSLKALTVRARMRLPHLSYAFGGKEFV
jgi:hypothetical protein